MNVLRYLTDTPARYLMILAATLITLSACEKKERACTDGEVMVDGECVPEPNTPEDTALSGGESPDKASPTKGDPAETATTGQNDDNPDQGTKKSPGKGTPAAEQNPDQKDPNQNTGAQASLGDAECSSTIIQGSSQKEDYLKCLFMGGKATTCYTENSCKVTLTTAECNTELTRLKNKYPETTTTWTCS